MLSLARFTLPQMQRCNWKVSTKRYISVDARLQLPILFTGYFQVSSPVLRDVHFRYQEDEILANSLTSTNFHTYYQGSELVVAGRLPYVGYDTSVASESKDEKDVGGGVQNPSGTSTTLIDYEIVATQALGNQYRVGGHYSSSKVITKHNATL